MNFKQYNNIDYIPLTVICELVRDVSCYDVIHFDGILAAAVVRDQFHGQGLPDLEVPHNIPLPLKSLWMDERGYNCWAASSLLPVGEVVEDVIWMHKRAQSGEFTKHKAKNPYKLNTTTGRFMERRIPVPTMVVNQLYSRCIGNKFEIERLLQLITHVGKRRNAGIGEVKEWIIEDAEWNDIDIFVSEKTLIKPLPYQAAVKYNIDLCEEPTLCSWFPSYWESGCQGEGWRVGTQIK